VELPEIITRNHQSAQFYTGRSSVTIPKVVVQTSDDAIDFGAGCKRPAVTAT